MKKIFIALGLFISLFLLTPQNIALAAGDTQTTGDGQVVIQTEDGIMYLDSTTVPATEDGTKTTKTKEIFIPEGFFQDLGQFINKALTLIIALAALMVFMYLIWGGIDWITSGGDKAKTDQARQKIIAAVIGLIIVAASFAILTVVLNFLGISSLQDALDQATDSNATVVRSSSDGGDLESLIEE